MQTKTKKTFWLINQYASTPDTGIGGRHYYLAKELAKQGHKVYLIAASYSHLLKKIPDISEPYKIESVSGFKMVWVKVPAYKHAHHKMRVRNWFLFTWKLLGLKRIIADKPDVILYSSPSLVGYLGAERLAQWAKAKLAFEVRDIWPLTLVELGGKSPKHPFIRFLQWIEDRAYKKSDFVLSNLPRAVDHMVTRGMPERKFHWIPNGVDLAYLEQKNLQQDSPIIENIKKIIPENKFVVGYTGTLGLANAMEYFVKAASLLKDDNDIFFVVVGEGREKAKLINLAEKLDNIVFIDAVDKSSIQSVLKIFDICFIGLSRDPLFKYGVSPNKLFDYFAAKKPIIYAIDSGAYQPVLDANAGLSIEPENVAAISNAILKLKNNNKRELMGKSGYNYAYENHNYSNLAYKLAVIFD